MHYDPLLGAGLWAATLLASTPKERGDRLEDLAAYLFWTSGEYEVRAKVRGLDAETDLIVRSLTPTQPPHSDLGGYLMVECKNTATSTNSTTVKKFAANVRLSGCRCGVLMTVKGLSGGSSKSSLSNAAYTVRKHYFADGTILIVLDGDTIADIVSAKISLVGAMRAGYETIRFDYIQP